MRPSKARSELSVGLVCHLRWVTYEGAVHLRPLVTHPRWKPDAGKPPVLLSLPARRAQVTRGHQ